MNAREATDTLGTQRTRWECAAMVRALTFHPWLNTWDDEQRLVAGAWALKHWREYQREVYTRLNRRGR